MARHAELREVLDHWAGVLAAAADSGGPVRSALFASHVAKEDTLLLPALERSGTDLAAVAAREPFLAGGQCAA